MGWKPFLTNISVQQASGGMGSATVSSLLPSFQEFTVGWYFAIGHSAHVESAQAALHVESPQTTDSPCMALASFQWLYFCQRWLGYLFYAGVLTFVGLSF